MAKKINRKAMRMDDDTSVPMALPNRQKTSAKTDELEKNNKSLTGACSLLTVLLVVLWIVADVQKSAICNNLMLESLRPDINTICNQNPLQFTMSVLARI